MNVLLSAYACAPGKGSEPEIGWSWMQQVSRVHDVWVITRESKRERVEEGLRREPSPRAHFVYVDLPRPLRFFKHWPGGVYIYYYIWQFLAYLKARQLHRQIGFGLVHHVTFCMYWLPSFMAMLDVPFVWGPVGGGESAPKTFRRTFTVRGRIYETLRDLAQVIGTIDPAVRMTARRSTLALATTQQSAERLRALGCKRVRVLTSVGVSQEELNEIIPCEHRAAERLRMVSAGRLLHWKGFHLALEAIARVRDTVPSLEYWIYGEGAERESLEKLVKQLGISDRVHLCDAIPREQLMRVMVDFDVLLHPSLHDSGAFVCVEAMTAGCAVVCLDVGGPAIQVTEETGIKIAALSPEQTVRDLAAAIEKLANDSDFRHGLARAARQRAQNVFAWEKRVDCLPEVYAQA